MTPRSQGAHRERGEIKVTREAACAATAGPSSWQEASQVLESRPGLVFMVATGVPADGSGVPDLSERLCGLAKTLTTGGVVGTALLGRRSRLAAATAGAALVASSALTRFGIFAAGMESAENPRFTVEPQLARLRERGER
jgi:hypothetical protein